MGADSLAGSFAMFLLCNTDTMWPLMDMPTVCSSPGQQEIQRHCSKNLVHSRAPLNFSSMFQPISHLLYVNNCKYYTHTNNERLFQKSFRGKDHLVTVRCEHFFSLATKFLISFSFMTALLQRCECVKGRV